MTKLAYILLTVGAILLFSPLAEAAQRNRMAWSASPNRRTGLYTTRNTFVAQGVGVNASAVYYFGDVDNEGVAFNGGFNINNISLGGTLSIFYNHPVGNHCNLRFALLGGSLRGNNELKFKTLSPPRDDFRKFHSILIQPSFGVQYYPFSNAGFYLFGGVALSASIIEKYEFYYYPQGSKERRLLTGSTYGFLPMIQLALGYSFKLTQSWSLSLELMLQEGVIDTHYMNLDAWPLAKSQNSDNIELGTSFGTYTDRYGKQHIHWNDGWFQLGISITYHWRECEHCRLINNYQNIKPRRR